MLKARILVFVLLLALGNTAPLIAGKKNPGPAPTVYITPMEQGFDGFLAAEIIDQKLPVSIAGTEEGADYILAGSIQAGENKWYNVMFGGLMRDRNQGSIRLVNVATKKVVWAASSGDRSGRGGGKKLAQRVIKDLKHDLDDVVSN